MLDPDFGWHLRVGEDILEQKSLPEMERYNYPIHGISWVDHEWLLNILFYEVFTSHRYGYLFLSAFFSAIVTLCFVTITLVLFREMRPGVSSQRFFYWSIFFQALAVFSLDNFFGVRPQILSWLFFTLLLLLFYSYIKTRQARLLLIFPILSLIWANLHGSFILGIALFGAFSMYFIVFPNAMAAVREKFMLAGSLVVGTLATLITPYGIDLWTYIVIDFNRSSYYHHRILEWLPVYMGPFFQTSFVIISSAVIILAYFQTEEIRRWRHRWLIAILMTPLFLMAVRHVRHIPFFVIASYPLLVVLSTRIFPFPAPSRRSRITSMMALGILVIIPLITDTSRWSPQMKTDPFTEGTSAFAPYAAVEFLKKQPESTKNLRLLNHYGLGGYLDWQWKEKLIFIDGRIPLTLMPNGKTFLEEYNRFVSANDDEVSAALDAYDIELVLWMKQEILFPDPHALDISSFLFHYVLTEKQRQDILSIKNPLPYLDAHWEKIYEDEVSLVYKKR